MESALRERLAPAELHHTTNWDTTFDCRRVKLHHSYTISELSVLIGAHKHTVGRWIAAGLKTIDTRRPLLIHGADFRAFMKAREPIKKRCQPGEFS